MEESRLAAQQEESGLTVGESISHYRIVASLGVGGMGEVYLAHDLTLGRQVAIKLLPVAFTADAERLRRFEQEARAASALNHPNIVTIYEIGQDCSFRFIAQEFIDGVTLREHMTKKPMTCGEVLEVIMQVTSALAAAHAKGIVHRDIKPENIMISRAGHLGQRENYVKVVDFGIAKLTEPDVPAPEIPTRPFVTTNQGTRIGTTPYMSPEQIRGERLDVRTDIWSLGVVMHEILTGQLPFPGQKAAEISASILKDEPLPLPPGVPDGLKLTIKKALRKDREDRYQTAGEMFVDLQDQQQRETERLAQTLSSKSSGYLIATERDGGTDESAAQNAKIVPLTPPGTTKIKQHKRGGLLILASIVAVTLAISYFVYSRYWGRSGNPDIRSIAVLPFGNADNNPDVEYLSDGISEGLINSLSQLPGVKVIARSSSFTYKGKTVDPQEVAKTLGVRAIVTGRIIARGDNLQISVELIDAWDKTQVWGELYNRKIGDLQTLQGEISRSIAEKLRVKLTGTQEQQLTKHPTQIPEAYQFYLNGEFYIRKTGTEANKKALNYYNQAIALDPNFAEPYAGVAEIYTLLSGPGLDQKENHSRAKVAAQKAIELDGTLTRPHVWLGFLKADEWDWMGAENEFKRALELNPNNPGVHALYPFYLSNMERHTEALAEVKLAQELDPLQVRPMLSAGIVLYKARRYDESIRQLQRVVELANFADAHFFLGRNYAMKMMYAEAIVEYEKYISLEREDTSVQTYLAYTYAMSGKRGKALAILNKLRTTMYVSAAELAIVYAGLGEKEQAFQSLKRACDAHDPNMQGIKSEPHYDSLRSDSRFVELVRCVGLPQ